MVIALNPGDDQFEPLEKIARQRPSARGREAEISRPGLLARRSTEIDDPELGPIWKQFDETVRGDAAGSGRGLG